MDTISASTHDDLVLRRVRLIGPDGRWTDNKDVVIRGDKIASILRSEPGLKVSPSTQQVECSGELAIPGMINAHTHTHNALHRATSDEVWLELHVLRMSEGALFWTPDDYYAAAALNALEMISSGTTSAIDMVRAKDPDWSEKIEAVVRAYDEVGMDV